MDLKKIKTLLEKYYNGETTAEEESILRQYFSGEQIDLELTADRDIFLYQIQEKEESDQGIPDISNEIMNILSDIDMDKTKKIRNLRYIYLRIAASVVLLIGSYFIIKTQVFDKNQDMAITGTFEDPELAYEQAKETLLYVSAMLNTGTKHMEPLQKIEEGTEPLIKLSSFNKGLEELKPIKTYDKAQKYIK